MNTIELDDDEQQLVILALKVMLNVLWTNVNYRPQVGVMSDGRRTADTHKAFTLRRRLKQIQQEQATHEALYLVSAGGDNYYSKIVPASRLDDAYLLTQWCSLDDIDPERRVEALEHFHDRDQWTYADPLRSGEGRIAMEFSMSFEDGWVRVVRLPAGASYEAINRSMAV